MQTVTNKKKIIFFITLIIAVILIAAFAIWKVTSGPKLQGVPRPAHSQKDPIGEFKNSVTGGDLEPAAENDLLKLYFDNKTGGIAVEDKGTGEIFCSSPRNAMEDAKATDEMKNQLSSPILLTYFNRKLKTVTVFDSYKNAILLNQVTWAKLENGIRVNMTLGREETSRLIPEQISAESFDILVQRIEENAGSLAAKKVKAFYLFYTWDTADDEQKAKYPGLESTDIYSLKTSLNDRDKKTLEEYFKEAGYTYEEMGKEYAALEYESNTESFPCFKLSVDYILNKNSLEVSLDAGKIWYDKSQFYLSSISMLPYFGAGETGKEGYIFLPDGSGTLIGFNNDGSKSTILTRGKTYGYDAAENQTDRGSIKNEFRYPVFGTKTGERAIFGIITDGDAVSGINCELGNISHSYNTSYADFLICRYDQNAGYNTFEQDPWIKYDEHGYNGYISLKYYFLTGENADYVGMAKAYRNYLLDQGTLTPVIADENLPFILETLGTIEKPVRKFGIPTRDHVAATTFNDSYKMLEFFHEKGVSNLLLRYQDWYNGGYEQTAASAMKVEKAIGGRKELKRLGKNAASLGARVVPDVNFLTHYENKRFDGFSPARDGVRTLFQKNGYYPVLITPAQFMAPFYWSVNPRAVLSYFTSFTSDYDMEGISDISLGSTGEVLNSNYNDGDYVSRQDSKNIVVEMLKRAAQKYDNIIVDAGNAYTFGYADYILNLPATDSSYTIAEQSVPFIQIALHGYVQYANTPLNLSSELDKDVLRGIETGSIPYFFLTYDEGSLIKEAYIYEPYYSVDYDTWRERAAKLYHEFNGVLSGLQNIPISDHEKLAENVYLTTYENGTGIYVNYSNETAEANGVTIAPMSYAVKQIGGQ